MAQMNLRTAVASLLLAALPAFPVMAPAQEHPEHPKSKPGQEHPEHPKDKSEKSALTVQELAQEITAYVTADAGMKGGYFLVYDPVAKAPLALTLDKVHEDKLAGLGDGVYFACADFKAADGTVYDLDVFMKEAEHGLETTEVTIHKVSGKARYTWKEEAGVWKREDVK